MKPAGAPSGLLGKVETAGSIVEEPEDEPAAAEASGVSSVNRSSVGRSIDRSRSRVSSGSSRTHDPVVVVDNLVVIFKSDEGCTQLT